MSKLIKVGILAVFELFLFGLGPVT
jgi:hypothetical protein